MLSGGDSAKICAHRPDNSPASTYRICATNRGYDGQSQPNAPAVNNAAPVIDPTAKVFPGHSSDPGKH